MMELLGRKNPWLKLVPELSLETITERPWLRVGVQTKT